MKLALTGLAGSGKDTVADIIREFHPELTAAAFADPLKEFLEALFENLSRDHFYTDLKEVYYTAVITKESEAAALEIFRKYYCKYAKFGITLELLAHHLQNKVAKCGDNYSIIGTSPRELMQIVGTDCLRHQDKNIHIKVRMQHPPNIITDVRFQNEAEAAQLNGYTVIRILGRASGTRSHSSELGVPEYLIDTTIVNNETIPVLRRKVKEIIGE